MLLKKAADAAQILIITKADKKITMSQNVHLSKKALTYPNSDIEIIIRTIETLSNSKQLAVVSELIDIHTRRKSRKQLSIQKALFGKQPKAFVFVSCLN